jgi:ABC-type transporter lipoprotein component MlaA
MTHILRACSVLIAAALGLVAVATPALALNAPQCPMSGTLSDWGFNSTGYIMIPSGGMDPEVAPPGHTGVV